MKPEKYHDRLLWEDYTFLNSFELYREIEEAKRQPETFTVYVLLIINKDYPYEEILELSQEYELGIEEEDIY